MQGWDQSRLSSCARNICNIPNFVKIVWAALENVYIYVYTILNDLIISGDYNKTTEIKINKI